MDRKCVTWNSTFSLRTIIRKKCGIIGRIYVQRKFLSGIFIEEIIVFNHNNNELRILEGDKRGREEEEEIIKQGCAGPNGRHTAPKSLGFIDNICSDKCDQQTCRNGSRSGAKTINR